MNKLLISDIVELKNGTYLVDLPNNSKIIINGEVYLYLINQEFSKLYIELKDNSSLIIYNYSDVNNNSSTLNINQVNDSKFIYNQSFTNKEARELIINNNILGNNNLSKINIRNISDYLDSNIIINVFINKNTCDNIALENIKGINNGGLIHIEPNIMCESFEVSANHLTTIGSLNKVDLDYLMSKGIKKNDAKKLLLDGFRFSNMDEEIKNLIGGE